MKRSVKGDPGPVSAEKGRNAIVVYSNRELYFFPSRNE
jgi:hypothetical protein